MSEIDTRNPVPAADRQPWQPLGYDKIPAAEAEAGAGSTFDSTTYS